MECGKKLYNWLNVIFLITLILHFIPVQSFSQVVTLPPRLLVIHSCIWAAVLLGSVELVCCRLLFAQRAARAAKHGESCTPASTKKEHASWTTVPWLESVASSYAACKMSCTPWSARQERGKIWNYHVEAKGCGGCTRGPQLSAPVLTPVSSESLKHYNYWSTLEFTAHYCQALLSRVVTRWAQERALHFAVEIT